MTADRPLRVAVLFDTAGFVRSLPLTGAAARTLHLNAQLEAFGIDVTLLLCDLNPSSQPTSAWPFPVAYLSPETMYQDTAHLRSKVASHAPDVIVVSNTNLLVHHGRAVADAVGCALVYEMLDDEAALLHSIGASPEATYDAARLQRLAIGLADGVVALTDTDAGAALRSTSGPVYVVPCGTEQALPPPTMTPGRASLVFVGNVHYEPNLRAVRYLRHTLAPALHRTGHQTAIDVFGRYPPEAAKLAHPDLLRLHGPVPDLAAALGAEAIGLAPIDAGSGMKLKVLQYMAAGLPIVGTPLAFTGLDRPSDFALISADDLSDFPDLVTRLLDNPALRHSLGGHGHHLATSRFAWNSVAQVAAQAYAEIAGHRRETVPYAIPPDVADLAASPPYWLNEWRNRHRGSRPMTPTLPDGDDMPEELAASVACARASAEASTGQAFGGTPRVGYGARSVIILDDLAVLKMYTHRGVERMERERAGLVAAAEVAGLQVPAVLGDASPPGGLPWLAVTRLGGDMADGLPPDPGVDAQVGRLAARLHGIDPSRLATLPRFERSARPRDDTPAAAALAAGLTAVPADVVARCTRAFVHGDYSRRNVLVDGGTADRLIDFERCGTGCPYNDLATFQLHDAYLGPFDGDAMLTAYADELSRLLGRSVALDRSHLGWHVAHYAAWILQWAYEVDPPLAGQVAGLVPHLVNVLPGPALGDGHPHGPDR